MRRPFRTTTVTTVVVAALVAASAAGAPAAVADGLRPSPMIVGGEKAPDTPWVVQVYSTSDHPSSGGVGVGTCTGEQVSPEWVLTARHCIDTDFLPPDFSEPVVTVHHSNSMVAPGPAASVDRVLKAPTGDVALLHLSSPKVLGGYAPLDLDHAASTVGTGTIMGYGYRANGAEPVTLYQATVSLSGNTVDALGAPAQHVDGLTGTANHGDSGGPLVVGGRVVALCSGGDVDDPGDDITVGARYSLLSNNAAWLRSTAGL